jgi:hypothetical protein
MSWGIAIILKNTMVIIHLGYGVFSSDTSYPEENNLQGLMESGPTENCLGCR